MLDFSMAGLSSNQRRDCMFHAVKTLSRLHGFTPSALGLDGFGKSNDYCGRVVSCVVDCVKHSLLMKFEITSAF